eukprot:Nitzschia sp. Nitz4//scaffold84_size84139//58185//59207//NITZ4_005206-RA/size84139-processed-gene-0.7-mRNA-1//1//CDS//3329559057//2523//frame0
MSQENADGIVAQRAKAGFQFREDVAPGLLIEMALKNILYTTETEYQQVDVLETYFGKHLITDGKTQSTQFDEFAYHESLIHPVVLSFCHFCKKAPKKVFIGGGGELATAREVLRHPQIEKVVMVDLDGKLVDVCEKYLPEWGGSAVRSNPRLELIIGDAYEYLMNCKETFDVVIMDISDPIEAGPGIMLYTKELYEHVSTLMSPNGVFVSQAGTGDAIPPPHAYDGQKDTTCFGPIRNTLAEVFPCVIPYTQAIPSFGSDWGFVMAFKAENPAQATREWIRMEPEIIDELIETYIEGGEKALRMYDGVTHGRMFSLTKATRKQLYADTRVMTKENPVFMY